MQIPTGVMVDRYGPRRVLSVALVFLGLGQILLAEAHSYPLGLLARGVLGFGDALTFVSVLRLIAAHFPGRQYAAVTSFTSAIGYIGNLAATVPLALVLDGEGWTPTFLVAGLITALYAVVVILRVKDDPDGVTRLPAAPVSPRELGRQVASVWRVPGTRLGFWVHFTTMFAPNVLALLWAVPFLVQDQGRSQASASALLIVFVGGSMIGGPLIGTLISGRPSLRMPLVGGYLTGAAVIWALLLSWNGQIPLGFLVPAFAFLALGGPASMIGFALARDYNPLMRVGTATGVVNVGGFVATTIAALAVGVLLQWTGGNFRLSLLALVVVLVIGGFRMLVWWRRARAQLFAAEARGEELPVRIRRRRWDVSAPEIQPAAA
jgi:MFS family permease